MSKRLLTALPVFNEAKHLEEVLTEVRKYASDILVVNDGSTDGTRELLEEKSDIYVIHHEQNRGYGAGLRTAFEFASEHQFDVLVTIDCDGQHQPCLIPELAAAVFPPGRDPIDVVSGSRYLKEFAGDSRPPEARKQINMQITQLLNERLSLNLTDSFCGFKAYRVETLPKFEITEFGYAMPLQFWVQIVAHRLTVEEFPVPLIYLEEERSFGGSLDDSEKRLAYYLEVFECEMERFQESLRNILPSVECGVAPADDQI